MVSSDLSRSRRNFLSDFRGIACGGDDTICDAYSNIYERGQEVFVSYMIMNIIRHEKKFRSIQLYVPSASVVVQQGCYPQKVTASRKSCTCLRYLETVTHSCPSVSNPSLVVQLVKYTDRTEKNAEGNMHY